MIEIYHDKYNYSIFVLINKNQESFTVVYNQRDTCPICGEHSEKVTKKRCHIYLQSPPFKLVFGGYYYTDYSGFPINKWGSLIYNLENKLTSNTNLVYEITKFRLDLFERVREITWMTWIPSTNTQAIRIFKKLAKVYKWEFISPHDLMNYNSSVKTNSKNRVEKVKEKYVYKKLATPIIDKIEGRIGCVFDDFYFSGSTMNQFLSFTRNLNIPFVYGITLGKIPHHKLKPTKLYP